MRGLSKLAIALGMFLVSVIVLASAVVATETCMGDVAGGSDIGLLSYTLGPDGQVDFSDYLAFDDRMTSRNGMTPDSGRLPYDQSFDLHVDGVIDYDDFLVFSNNYHAAAPSDGASFDLNGDGSVNEADYPSGLPEDHNGQLVCVPTTFRFVDASRLCSNGAHDIGFEDGVDCGSLCGNGCASFVPTCVGDFDGDGVVEFDDMHLFIHYFSVTRDDPGWDEMYNLNAEEDSADVIDFDDYFAFVDIFGSDCR